MRKSHLCRSWSAAVAASYRETIFFTCSSLLAGDIRLLPEIILLQGDELFNLYFVYNINISLKSVFEIHGANLPHYHCQLTPLVGQKPEKKLKKLYQLAPPSPNASLESNNEDDLFSLMSKSGIQATEKFFEKIFVDTA
ncbi:hypothetical protein OUZ56_011789 [Daphnia magna]|uniref:Uncharacterized protein n=1 Tax=Daphnia magna TaxID=35525 RepID=A0ABQ9Z153_9CRUS|nr:hypothetical protein OUZ56_011789 [Daphnia magna]